MRNLDRVGGSGVSGLTTEMGFVLKGEEGCGTWSEVTSGSATEILGNEVGMAKRDAVLGCVTLLKWVDQEYRVRQLRWAARYEICWGVLGILVA